MALDELVQARGPIPPSVGLGGGGHPPPSLPQCGVTPQHLPSVFQGNDQVRFELTCYALCPKIKVRHPKLSLGAPPPGFWPPPELVRNFVLTPM